MTTGLPPHKEISWMTFVNQHMGDLPPDEDNKQLTIDYDKEKLKEEALVFMHEVVEFEKLDSSDSSVTNVNIDMNNREEHKEITKNMNLKYDKTIHHEDASTRLKTSRVHKKHKPKCHQRQRSMNRKLSNFPYEDRSPTDKRKNERREMLDYFNRKSIIFDSLKEQREEVVTRSRRNLKRIQQHFSRRKTGKSNSLSHRESTTEVAADDFCTQSQSYPYPTAAGKYDSNLNISETTSLSQSSLSRLGKEDLCIFENPLVYKQHTNSNYNCKCIKSRPKWLRISPEVSNEEPINEYLLGHEYERNSWKIDLEIFKHKVENISQLTKQLLFCLYVMGHD